MDEIHREIQQIRTDMGNTIDAIQERISPEHLMDQARLAVQEVTHGAAADVAQNARDTAAGAGSAALNVIREHPIPVALAGLGVGWLLTHRPNPAQASQGIASARDQIGTTVGDTVNHVQDTAQQVGSQAATQANRANGFLQQALQDNPLAVGAAAIAIGAIVGLAVPQTQQEHQLMGPTRDRLVAKAQDTAQDTAQDVAQRVQTAAQDTAQKVQHVAQEARDAAQRAAQQDGLL